MCHGMLGLFCATVANTVGQASETQFKSSMLNRTLNHMQALNLRISI